MSSAAATREPSSAARIPTVLCIDDDPDVTAAIEMHMRKFEAKVVRAFHGMHGFAEALRESPDVIIMDVAMPSGDGATILEWLRRNRQTENIPVLVLTGMRDPRLVRRIMDLGADRYLRKPIRLNELMHQLRRFIDLRLRQNDD